MRSLLLTLSAACLTFALSAAHADDRFAHAQPQHGGIVVSAQHLDWELVARDGRAVLHVRDHATPVDTAGAKGQLTVLPAGGEQTKVPLAAAAAGTLSAAGVPTAPGTRYVASVVLPGRKPVQLRFALP